MTTLFGPSFFQGFLLFLASIIIHVIIIIHGNMTAIVVEQSQQGFHRIIVVVVVALTASPSSFLSAFGHVGNKRTKILSRLYCRFLFLLWWW